MSSQPDGRLGNQEPRLRSVPAYSATLGHEAVDLAAAAGLVLDPWQRDVVLDILAVQDDGRWAAFETCTIAQRQQGKGAIIETIELAGLFLFGEQLILHSAHEYKTAQEAFLRIVALVDGCTDLSRYVKAIREANGEQQIILMSGARLRFVARSKGSGRGFSGQRNILDEAYALTRTQLAALLPTMSAQPNPQLNQFSTVPDPDTMPDPDEAVLPAIHARAIEADRTGEAGTLVYHDWSSPIGENPEDVNVWYECNPALGIRITEDYVRAELAALGPAKFATERLGRWPAEALNAWAVIPEADWTDALDELGQPQDPVVFSVDTTPERTQSAIAVVGSRADGDLHGELVDHRPGTGWVVARVVDLVKRWRPAALVIDPAGAASGFIADLQTELCTGVTPLLPEITLMKARGVAQAYGMFHLAVKKHPDAELLAAAEDWSGPAKEPSAPEEPVKVRRLRVRERQPLALTKALAGAATRRIGDGTTWDRRSTEVDIAPLVALTNALHGFLTMPEPEPPMPPPATPSAMPGPSTNFFRPTGRLSI